MDDRLTKDVAWKGELSHQQLATRVYWERSSYAPIDERSVAAENVTRTSEERAAVDW